MLSPQNAVFTGSTSLLPFSFALPPHSLLPYTPVALKTSKVPFSSSSSSFGCCCSLRLQELSMEELLEARKVFRLAENDKDDLFPRDQHKEEEEDEEEEEEEMEKGISKIQVSREKYIPVSKAELLDAIVSKFFDSQDDANQFLLLSSCLDAILYAEHKGILEQMRADYSLIHSMDNEETASSDRKGEISDLLGDGINGIGSTDNKINMPLHFDYGPELRNLLGSSARNDKRYSKEDSKFITNWLSIIPCVSLGREMESMSRKD